MLLLIRPEPRLINLVPEGKLLFSLKLATKRTLPEGVAPGFFLVAVILLPALVILY